MLCSPVAAWEEVDSHTTGSLKAVGWMGEALDAVAAARFSRGAMHQTPSTPERLWVWINYQITESHISVNAYMKKRNYFPPEKYLSPYQTFMPKEANVMKWSEATDLSFVFFIHFGGGSLIQIKAV